MFGRARQTDRREAAAEPLLPSDEDRVIFSIDDDEHVDDGQEHEEGFKDDPNTEGTGHPGRSFSESSVPLPLRSTAQSREAGS